MRQTPVGSGSVKDRALSILLALLLGNFGVHRFYLGDIAWGIVYLVFFWTGIPGIIASFEALYFLVRSDVDWARDRRWSGATCQWPGARLPLIRGPLAVPGES